MFSSRNAHQGMHKRARDAVFRLDEKIPAYQGQFDLETEQAVADSSDGGIIDGVSPLLIVNGSGTEGLMKSQSFAPQAVCLTTENEVNEVNLCSEVFDEADGDGKMHIGDGKMPCAEHVKEDDDKPDGNLKCVPPKAVQPKLDSTSQDSGKQIENTLLSPAGVAGVMKPKPPLPEDSVPDPPPSTQSASHKSHKSRGKKGLPSGKMLICGRRREMEDTASIVPSFLTLSCVADGVSLKSMKSDSGGDHRSVFSSDIESNRHSALSDLHFFGVYDGHGGSQASTHCMKRFHHLLSEEILNVSSLQPEHTDEWSYTQWDEVMKTTFLKMDKEVGGVCPNGLRDDDETMDSGCTCCVDAVAPENVGTTAVVAVVGPSQIVVGNCGDSRALLVRGSSPVPLSKDHKPELEEETSRIEAAGGRVICWDGYRVGGLLALSRAIGDRYLKRYVISEPDVRCIQRTEDDECLILASDGLWDVISNEFASEVVRRSLAVCRRKYRSRTFLPGEDPVSSAVAANLVKVASTKGSKDNITVVIVDLKARCCV